MPSAAYSNEPLFNQEIDFCAGHEVEAKSVKPFARKAWRLSAWERPKLPSRVRFAHRNHLRCAKSPAHRKAIKRFWTKRQAKFKAHRQRKLAQERRLRYLPHACSGGVRSAIPCSIMWCESEGSYTARNTESTAGGKYQIIDSTWFAYGGVDNGDSHPAAAAPPEEQDRIALDIWNADGAGAWVCA